MSIYIGIDSGLSGAIASINDHGEILTLEDTPTLIVKGTKARREYNIPLMLSHFKKAMYDHETAVGIEVVHAMPGQGVSSMFKMGYGLGIWEGIITCFYVRLIRVSPQRWKKIMLDGMGKEKSASLLRAQQLFPHASLYKKKDHGRAEALLIAEYCRRLYLRGEHGKH